MVRDWPVFTDIIQYGGGITCLGADGITHVRHVRIMSAAATATTPRFMNTDERQKIADYMLVLTCVRMMCVLRGAQEKRTVSLPTKATSVSFLSSAICFQHTDQLGLLHGEERTAGDGKA